MVKSMRKSHKRKGSRKGRKTYRRKQRGGAVECGKFFCEEGQICGFDSIGQPMCKTINNSYGAGKTSGPAGPKAPGAPVKK